MTAVNEGLATLTEPNGSVPETRMKSASEAQAVYKTLWEADQVYRSPKRAKVKGLVDGNPPYRQADLRKAGRSNDCNVNWRIAEAYLNSALGAFYDLFSESPTYATINLDIPIQGDREEKSRIVTEEFDRLQRREAGFDYNMQISQYEMVLYGFGPFTFNDGLDWRAKAGRCGDFYVPNEARSTTSEWEMCMMRVEYLPHQLYEFIRNEEAAEKVGWDVPSVKRAIMNACPRTETNYQSWEWYQQQLKDGSFYFSYQAGSKKIFTVHLWCKEFPKDGEVEGRISHKIFLENEAEQSSSKGSIPSNTKFLFERIGRFKDWNECVHAMYYDRGGGGDHHSVTGMGVKMFSAMEYQNRLLCKLADDAFSPKMIFKPTTASDSQKMSLAQMGNYAAVSSGWDLIQTPINPLIQETLLFNREVSQTISANLSQYRQNLQKDDGNPITATETKWKASEQSRLGKTQLNRYYEQLDGLYAEKYRRATNPNLTDQVPGGKEALEFQKRCADRGVTKTDLRKVDTVQATRVVGQGSVFMRQEALEFLLGMVSMLPEGGRERLIRDVIAARAGQTSVQRYFPSASIDTQAQAQKSEAMDKVAGMKVGMQPLITDLQNPVIYAETYLAAASQAAASLQQGADPMEVYSFLNICGPAIAAQLDRIKSDPSRKRVYEILEEQWQKLAQLNNQLGQQIQEQMQQQAEAQSAGGEAQSIASGVDPNTQIKMAETQAKLQMQQAKTNAALEQKAQKHLQSMAIADEKAKAELSRQSQKQTE